MPDREKVIREFEYEVKKTHDEEWDFVYLNPNFADKLLALLKEQEHKDRMFHALEDDWKRLKELLKEQEADEPRVSTAEQRCGHCNKVIEMDGWQSCPWCGKRIDWKGWWKKNGTRNQDS